MIQKIKSHFSSKFKQQIKYKVRTIIGYFFWYDLNRLAQIHRTDKYMIGGHEYTPIYTEHFKKFQFRRNVILEIGVGGYNNPISGGNSLRMLKNYFPFSKIFAIDIYDKSFHEERRIQIFQGSQENQEFLIEVSKKIKNPHIIIDDGSHINSHVISSFTFLFPLLREGGIYVVEDTQTSYWKNMGGDCDNLNNTETTMGFFKTLLDGLNHSEFIIPGYKPTYFDLNIKSIHFYHNMVFIYKGANTEKSNAVIDNSRFIYD